MMRPGTASRNPNLATVTGRPPGTATRLTTGMAGHPPGTRGGIPAGTGVGIGLAGPVDDRPMTQQGLGGMKTSAGRASKRVVQDKTYYYGLVRTKINELFGEIQRMKQETTDLQEEQSTYLTYEKKAESLAADMRDLQAQLGDYNTLLDKLNTREDIQDIQRDFEELKAKNDHESKSMDVLFAQKQDREKQIQHLEVELEQERQMSENLVSDMPRETREKYLSMKAENTKHLSTLERLQQDVDELNTKRGDLEDELSLSQVKQEAVRLYGQLHELEEKRDSLLREMQAEGAPQEQRNRLLAQVKRDNQEIVSMERQINDLEERAENVREEINQLEQDLEDTQGDRNAKYQELKKREKMMDEFLENFEANLRKEEDKIDQFQQNIVALLENLSRKMAQFEHLPTPQELATMKEDLAFKSTEMRKSEHTAAGLAAESQKLQTDLVKVEQLETKINSEMDTLKNKIKTMQHELVTFSDLDKLKKDAAHKKEMLENERVSLTDEKESLKHEVVELTKKYETKQAELNENEVFVMLSNLEKKWQVYEQNNFVMKEFIAAKEAETDYASVMRDVDSLLKEHNNKLQR